MTHLNPDAREVLELARDLDDPSDDDRSRHRAKLVGRLGAAAALTITIPAGASGALGAGTVATVAGAAAWKSVLVFALLGGAAGGAVCAVGELTRPHVEAPSVATQTEVRTLPNSPEPAVAGDGAPRLAPPLPQTEVMPSAESLAQATASARREPRENPAMSPPLAPVGTAFGATLQEEVDLIQRAHEALRRGEFALALRFVADHEARFPNGALAQERVAARVLAVCSLHRSGAADEARAFLAARPDSPLAARVRAACGL